MARDAGEPDDAGRGGGGKLTRRLLRPRVQSSPYARPTPTAGAEKRKGGWLSRIFDLPSLFSRPSSSSDDQDQNEDEIHDQCQRQSVDEIDQEGATVSALNSHDPSDEPIESDASAKRNPEVDLKGVNLVGNACKDDGFAEIEQRLQQKQFSIDETNRLIELLRSRTADLPDDGRHAKILKLEGSETTKDKANLATPSKGDAPRISRRVHWKSDDQSQFAANDDRNVGSSPIDIAKAYMEAQTPASGHFIQTGRSKNEKLLTDNATPRLSLTPVPKSSLCWPGATMQSDHSFITPRRGSVAHRSQTPYSRPLFSKSATKLHVTPDRANSSTMARSSTRVFGGNLTTARRTFVQHSRFAPVSPAHHAQKNNFAETFQRTGPSTPGYNFSSGFASAIERDSSSKSGSTGSPRLQPTNMADEASKFSVNSTPVHPQSSVMARKILEHLDRSVPTPKEKLFEISMARERVPLKLEAPSSSRQHDRSDVSNSEQQKDACLSGGNVVSEEIMDAQKDLSRESPSTSSCKNNLLFPQAKKQGLFGIAPGSSSGNPAAFRTPDNKANSAPLPTAAISIQTTKPNDKLENGSTFTFQVAKAPATFSEPPPTPTMPSSPTPTSTPPEADEGSVPTFTFGSKQSSKDRLDFSLASGVRSSDIDATTPKFEFGIYNKSRLSFKSISKDAVRH